MAVEASPSPAGPEKPTSVAYEQQAKALAELKALCEKDKLYWPASEIEGHPVEGRNDDDTLLYAVSNFNPCPRQSNFSYRRFLVARSYDPQAAYKQYSVSAAWRRKVALVQTYDNTEIQIFERMNRVVGAHVSQFALVRRRTHSFH